MAYTFKLQDGTEYLLERNPSRKLFTETPVDNEVKSKSDGGGYVMVHSTNTRDVVQYTLVYGAVKDTDRDMILAVDDACKSAEWFYWTHPITAEIKMVRFNVRPSRKHPFLNRSRISFELEEI